LCRDFDSLSGDALHQSWGISRGPGEESYEITPSSSLKEVNSHRPRALSSSINSVLDSVVSDNCDVRNIIESDDGYSESEGSPGPPKRNLLHNFLSTDVSTSSAESSVLQRVKHHHKEDRDAVAPLGGGGTVNPPDFEASTINNGGDSPSRKSEIGSAEQKESPPDLLDTMLAVPDMLQPKALAEAVAMVMHASKPHLLSKIDFIECFEVLMSSGIAAPLNSLLAAPTSKPVLKSDDIAAKECRPPKLHAGPKSRKLREQAASNPRRKAQSSSDKYRIECK
jgi:hypothetical protein